MAGIFSNQFRDLRASETWITPEDLFGAILCFIFGVFFFFNLPNKFKGTYVVLENAAMPFSTDCETSLDFRHERVQRMYIFG